MEPFIAYNGIYLSTLLPLLLPIYIIYFKSSTKLKWYVTDIFSIIMPGTIYSTLYYYEVESMVGHSKTLANLIEPIMIGVITAVLLLMRCVVANRNKTSSKKIAMVTLILIIIVTISVYLMTPALPE
jgi:hypothetical protein